MVVKSSNLASGVPNFPRFFGRRKGRPLKNATKKLLAEKLPKLLFDPLKPISEQFGPSADCFLEIGFGGGEHIAELANVMPHCHFIGAEPFINGVASLLRHIDRQDLRNIRIWPDDVRLILPLIAPRSFTGVFLMFPDPWPKRRHFGRRILQPELLDQLSLLMKPGARLVLASDDPTAKSWLLQATVFHSDFVWTAKCSDDWRKRPKDLPKTRYMKKADLANRKSSWFQFFKS